MAAYDPVFYLHHSNVDRQYAFWQELQKIRGQNTEAVENSHFEMPPFWNKTYNPDPIFEVTGKNATQSYGLDYETHYNYKYDQLIFDGKSPGEFLPECSRRSIMAAITVKDETNTTTNDILIKKADDKKKIATIPNAFVTLGFQGITSEKKFYFDVTEELIGVKLMNIDIEIVSYIILMETQSQLMHSNQH